MTYEFLKSLYKDTLMMLDNLVVKRQDLAQAAEDIDSIRAFELYYACLTGSRYFYDFREFDIDILEKYMSPQEVTDCYRDPNNIPQTLRSVIVDEQSKRVVENYVEKNEYYRMLNGQPPMNDHFWIYITDDTRIPADVPIHELSVEQIAYLQTRGTIDRLIEENPDKEYLQYLGINKIDIIDARLAKPFEILRTGIPSNSMVQTMFEKEYYGARRYLMATVYNRDMFTNKTLYDPIIASGYASDSSCIHVGEKIEKVSPIRVIWLWLVNKVCFWRKPERISEHVFLDCGDGKVICSLVTFTYIVFTEQQAVAYKCYYDIAYGKILEEYTVEVAYRDIDAVKYGDELLHVWSVNKQNWSRVKINWLSLNVASNNRMLLRALLQEAYRHQ